MPRKLVVYIACSADGYIAKPGDDLSFLSIVEKEGEDYGYSAFMSTVDTILMGRKTYDWVNKHTPVFPHAALETYIFTRTPAERKGSTHFYSGEIKTLVENLKQKEGKTIFCDGGAEIVHALMKENLVDEWIISVIPVFLGNGIRLFSEGRPETSIELLSATTFDKGLVQLHYKRK